ncbi:unnamed protein product [Ixodes hexagonus]
MAVSKPEVLRKYLDLQQPDDVVFCTYVFVDGSLENVRAKTKTLDFEPKAARDCPEWTFCGLGTYQWADASAKSEMFLVPVALFRDPFLKGRNKLVLCESLHHDRTPLGEKFIHSLYYANRVRSYHRRGGRRLGYTGRRYLSAAAVTGPYYYGVGADNVVARQVSDAHLKACVYAGVKVSGTNAEVVLSQWEYQVGPLPGVEAADHLWMSRYILHRVAEDFDVIVTLDPKPYKGNEFAGSAGHINFSTNDMRDHGGLEFIIKALKKLEAKSELHLTNYDPQKGKSNSRRLNAGMLATPGEDFSADKCSRLGSIRVPRLVVESGRGYLEDRRPGANVEPYLATETLVKTICLDA